MTLRVYFVCDLIVLFCPLHMPQIAEVCLSHLGRWTPGPLMLNSLQLSSFQMMVVWLLRWVFLGGKTLIKRTCCEANVMCNAAAHVIWLHLFCILFLHLFVEGSMCTHSLTRGGLLPWFGSNSDLQQITAQFFFICSVQNRCDQQNTGCSDQIMFLGRLNVWE